MCLGDGCQECGNDGGLEWTGKVEDLITRDGLDLFESYKWLKNYSQFPVEGGMFGQSSKFIACVNWCDSVDFKFRQYLEKAEKVRADFQKKFSAKMGKNGQ